ncbi:Protein kinase domain-containing protein [Microdochium nivale]|nr:Protein kinase domain-containing protein [Microdochium nivale]
MRGVTAPRAVAGSLKHIASAAAHAPRPNFAQAAPIARNASTVSHHGSGFGSQMLEPGVALKGYSGREYVIENVLQDRQDRFVYLAKADEKKFVLKNLFENEYNYALPLQLRYNSSPYLRALRDTIPDQRMFVNEYLSDHLLNFAFKDISSNTQKRIMRDALRGLATLHDHNIVHLDVKANNIMVDYTETPEGISVSRVQLSDLEDATYIPVGQALRGIACGNQLWRSPEAHAEGFVGKPSDVFSMALVFIFLRLKRVIFYNENDSQSLDPMSEILARQISTFAEWKDFEAFLSYLGHRHPQVGHFRRIAETFTEENPRQPFALWQSDALDNQFKDLICKMTCFDPRKRVTAQQALRHAYFKDIVEE